MVSEAWWPVRLLAPSFLVRSGRCAPHLLCWLRLLCPRDGQQTASAEETIVVPMTGEDGTPTTMLVAAQLDTDDGGLAWAGVADVNATYNSAVSTSQMTSMLRDHPRNESYSKALHAAIAAFRAQHKRAPVVLDIGTGTGLLVRTHRVRMCARVCTALHCSCFHDTRPLVHRRPCLPPVPALRMSMRARCLIAWRASPPPSPLPTPAGLRMPRTRLEKRCAP